MICVWWNYEGVVHWEIVPTGRTVNADLYSEQLGRVHEQLCKKYPELLNRGQVLLHHDNAPAHTAKKTRSTISDLRGVEVLPHPPYSPDLAPSDYYLFRSLSSFLRGQTLHNVQDLEKALQEFFDSKSTDWYFEGISTLAKRWQEVLDHDGYYFCD